MLARRFILVLLLIFIVPFSAISCKKIGINEQPEYSADQEGIDWSDITRFLRRAQEVFTRNGDDIARLHKNISNSERLSVLKKIPVSEIMSAPGHLELRNPAAVIDMAKQIERAGDGGRSFVRGKEKMVLNVFTKVLTTEDGRSQKVVIRSVEVMDGNHRLAAGLLAHLGEAQDHLAAGAVAKRSGRPVWQFIGDIPEEALEIRVNGDLPLSGGRPPRWIPTKIFDDANCVGPCRELKEGKRGRFEIIHDDRGGRAAQVSGSLSSLDDTIPDKFKGRPIFDVLKRSLSRASK